MKIVPFYFDNPFDLNSNSYLLVDDSNNCVVIDPSKAKVILDYIEANHLNLKAILLTHGHFDHIKGVKYFNVPVYIHKDDAELLREPKLNCSDRFSREDIVIDATPTLISDDEVLNILDEPIKVIHTPFHSMGSVCFYLKDSDALISGDTLFQYSIGRTDFITSDPSLINSSLAKLMKLPDQTVVYPGHGPKTTIGIERKLNSFVS